MRRKLGFLSFTGMGAGIVLLSVVLISCASAPAQVQTQGPVSLELMTTRDLWTYGTEFATNPFLPPANLAVGTPNEFVVLKLTLSLEESSIVNVGGAVVAADGSTVAKLYDEKEMERYWSDWGDSTTKTSRTRIETLQRYYIPSTQFPAPAGKRDYLLLLMGKNPLARPSTVNVSVALNAVSTPFSFTLEPRKK